MTKRPLRRRNQPVWVCDLDHTLYDATGVFPRMNAAMTRYMMRRLDCCEAQADALRRHYWQQYGATMTGLARHHAVPPREFMRATHPLAELLPMARPDLRLIRHLQRWPGAVVVFTNGPGFYARAMLRRLHLLRHVRLVWGIEHSGWRPKPQVQAYQRLARRLGVAAHHICMLDDVLDNLRPAKKLGWKTIWVRPNPDTLQQQRPRHIDHHAPAVHRVHTAHVWRRARPNLK